MKKNNINLFKKILFFGLVVLIALSSVFTSLHWMTSWLALVLGITFAIVVGNPYVEKTGDITNNLLKISVVGIGCGYPLSAISELSISSFYFVIIFIVLTVVIGFFIGKIFYLDRKITDMISSGTASHAFSDDPNGTNIDMSFLGNGISLKTIFVIIPSVPSLPIIN